MKKIFVAFLCAFALLANGSLMLAQEKQERRPSSATVVSPEGQSFDVRIEGGQFAWAGFAGQQEQMAREKATLEFALSEAVLGKPVKGAPYSAEAVTESVQVLADGNHIVQKSVASIYRDSEGRTRRDQTMKFRGRDGQNAEEMKTSFINDPVSGTSYTLHHNDRTAFKVMARKIQVEGLSDEDKVKVKMEMAKEAEAKARAEADTHDQAKMKHPPEDHPPMGEARAMIASGPDVVIAGGRGFAFNSKMDVKKESLGTQLIEGIQAEGSRATFTIPAGDIGNEQPITIVSEQWFSADLGMLILTRHSDPRVGETTYRVTNISRDEPDGALFQVPADYTVRDRTPRRF